MSTTSPFQSEKKSPAARYYNRFSTDPTILASPTPAVFTISGLSYDAAVLESAVSILRSACSEKLDRSAAATAYNRTVQTHQLQVFQTVARMLHFRRASVQLHMSLAALSSQIKKLEEDLGVELFERDKRAVRLTASGAELLANIPDFLEHDKLIRESVQERKSGEYGTLRLGFVSTASIRVIPQIIQFFEEHHPGIRLSLRNWITADQVLAIAHGDLDAGILRLPVSDPAVKTLLVHKEPFAVLLPARHALRAKTSLTLSDLNGQKQIIYSRSGGAGYHDQLIGMLSSEGNSVNITQEAADMYTVVAFVAAGLGIAVVPASVASRRLTHVVSRPLLGRLPKAQMGLAVRARRRAGTAGRAPQLQRTALKLLEDICREIFAKL